MPSSLKVGRSTVALLGVLFLAAQNARALTWPDVPDRVAHDLESADPAVRLGAAEKLESMTAGRATPLLLSALTDADASVRIAAAESAVRLRTKGATELVLPWLGERDARLRLAACTVARALPDSRAVAPLARALSDSDGVVRAGAALALGAQGSAEAVAPLLGKLDDPSPSVRVELARALARLGDRRAVVPLIGKVEDSVLEVREAVARALGELGDARAGAALVLQLRDNSAEVRVVALAALGRVGGESAVDAIAPLAVDRNVEVRHAALAALGGLARSGSGDALKVLVARLGQGDDAAGDLGPTPLRDALVKAGAPGIPQLREVLRGGASPAAMTSAAWVLGELGVRTAAPDIVAALRRGTLKGDSGLHALIGASTKDDLPVVLEFVGNENAAVRREALAAARALLEPSEPDGRAVEPLIAVSHARTLGAADQIEVIALLGRTRAPRASAVLQGFVAARDIPTKLAALDALGALGPTGADAVMLRLLSDPAPEVRLHAAVALGSSGGAAARDQLLDRLDTGNDLDRISALGALRGILMRAPSDRAWQRLGRALPLAAGGERDALLLTLTGSAPVRPVVERLASSEDADDRRTVATGCGGRVDAVPLLRRLLSDPDAGVRAQAAWALGSVATSGADGGLFELERIARSTSRTDADAAIDAAAAVGRVAGRTHDAQASALLCALTKDARADVRANALAGLALAGARCGDGTTERALLSDPSDNVREAAARAIATTTRSDDERSMLTRCAANDRSGEVARLCKYGAPIGEKVTHAVLVYVGGLPSSEPRPHAGYAVVFGDGLQRAGTADRRGAFFEPVAPSGDVRLTR